LLKEIEKSIQRSVEGLSILTNQYGYQTFSLLEMIDPDFKKVNTLDYLEDITKRMKSISHSIPSALNKLKWCNFLLIEWNKEKFPTDKDIRSLSKENNKIPVIMKINEKYLMWGKKNGKWQKTEITAEDGRIFEYTIFSEQGQIINIGNQFKNPDKINAIKSGHDDLKNQKGKKRGNNSQIAIKYLIAELARVYEQITQRKVSDDVQYAKDS